MKSIKLTWLGHSCWKIEKDGVTIVLDPMQDGSVPGVRSVRESADLVLCSHGHGDHNAEQLITLTGKDVSEVFDISSYECPHDDACGTKRGMNQIRILKSEGLSVAHMGDVGCIPAQEIIQALKGVDVMLLPVGGYFTLAPELAAKLVELTAPRVVIPMHYRTDSAGYDVISTVDGFLSFFDNTVYYDGPVFELDETTISQTAVMTYR